MRVDGWEAKLVATVKDATLKQYQSRKWNCARFAHACAEAVAGQEIPFKWRGSLEASADAVLDRIEPRQALRGDIVLAHVPEASLGVCVGRKAAFVTTEGLLTIPMSQISVAWGV